jgi:GT2 family glycosyltransferase
VHALVYGLGATALALAARSIAGLWRSRAYYAARLADLHQSRYLPRVTLIVPVKGPEEGLAENLRSLASQDYPAYELIVAARRAEDVPPGVVPETARLVLAGDGDASTGEKINNLIAAIREAAPEAEVFAFADSDGRVEAGWLRALVAPLAEPGAGASTGYRVYVPEPAGAASLMRALWNGSILASLGARAAPLAWGGAMAIRRETFQQARVLDFWRGTVSDDYGLAEAVRRAGKPIRFAPGALVASSDHLGWRALFGWIRRQLVITRVYNPRLWWMSLAATIIYCSATMASAAAAVSGDAAGLGLLGLLLVQEATKAAGWMGLSALALPAARAWARRRGPCLLGWAWLSPWVWLAGLAFSACGRQIEWRGRCYRLRRPRWEDLRHCRA